MAQHASRRSALRSPVVGQLLSVGWLLLLQLASLGRAETRAVARLLEPDLLELGAEALGRHPRVMGWSYARECGGFRILRRLELPLGAEVELYQLAGAVAPGAAGMYLCLAGQPSGVWIRLEQE
jgi:hypothetical protein